MKPASFPGGRLVAAILFALLLPAATWAQGSRGSITGTVKDPTGAVIPGIAVKVTQTGTGLVTTGQTQANGAYLVPNLDPGLYSVSVEATGFKKLTIDKLKVDVASTLTQDLTLQVGQLSDSVEVTGQSSLVQTTSGAVGTTINGTQILELVMTDRNAFSLVNLSPAAWLENSGRGTQVSLGGGRNQSQRATIDGIDNTRGGTGVQNVELVVPVDAVEEFKVQTNNMSAEYGFTNSGVLNVVTKSGSNAFHGSFFEFLRNDKFDADGWGNTTKQKLRRNDFGGTFGGPIRKNRTFFFMDINALRQVTGNTNIADVGLPAWRTGNFSTATGQVGNAAVVIPIYDPTTGTGTFGTPRATTPFPGNIIPASQIDPIAAKALSYYPDPNHVATNAFTNQGNYWANARNITHQLYWIGRVDHDLTKSTKIYGRYYLDWPFTIFGTGNPGFGPAGQNLETDRQQNMALNMSHLFSPTFFVNVTTGFSRFKNLVQGGCAECGVNYAQVLGVANVPGPVFPNFSFSGGNPSVTAIGGGPNRFANVTHSNLDADFTKVHGAHTWKFGAVYDRFNSNVRADTTDSGQWNFDGHFTRGVSATGAFTANTGINMADFELGRLTSATVSLVQTLGRRSQHYGVYFQDDWRASSNLTLNFGMRWDTQNPVYGEDDRFSNLNPYVVSPLAGTTVTTAAGPLAIPAGALGAMQYQNTNGAGKYLWDWDKKTFSPRVGFAWRVFGTNETVVRGGWGIFFGSPLTAGADGAGTSGVNGGSMLGYGVNFNVADPVPFRLRDGAPAGATLPPPQSALTGSFGQAGTPFATSTVFYYDPVGAYPYTMNYNLTIDHQWKNTLFEVAYIANLGRHTPGYAYNKNRIFTNLLTQTQIPDALRRPFPQYGSNATVSDAEPRYGTSNYHALTVRVERRFQNGLSYSISYAWSKMIDDVTIQSAFAFSWGDFNTAPQNIFNLNAEKSLSQNDIPHRLVIAPVYELPVGKGRRFLNHRGVVDYVLGGWQVSSVLTFQSGSPFGPTVLNGGTNILHDTLGALRPDLVGDPNSPNKGEPAVGVRGLQWLNPAAFATPAQFTYGSQARTLPGILGPGLFNPDVMIGKNFRFKERFRLQFRWEMLDATNTPHFALPAESLGGANFGVVTAVNAGPTNSRRIMQFGLKLYW